MQNFEYTSKGPNTFKVSMTYHSSNFIIHRDLENPKMWAVSTFIDCLKVAEYKHKKTCIALVQKLDEIDVSVYPPFHADGLFTEVYCKRVAMVKAMLETPGLHLYAM